MWQLPPLKRVGPDQFAEVFKQTPVATFGCLLNATIVAIALYPVADPYTISGWWISILGFCIWTMRRWYRNRNRVITQISDKAIPRSMVSAFLYALPWAALIVLYLGEIPHHEELVMGIAVIGMAAAGSVQLARIYPAALVYLGTILIPVLVKCVVLGGVYYYLLAALVVSYIFFLFSIVINAAIVSMERAAALRGLENRVAEIKEAKNALETFANTDDLTGLLNRRVFNQKLAESFDEARATKSQIALLFCDLDHFKNINDMSGHAQGDRLLKEVAARLNKCRGKRNIIARLGGDEFAMIARDPQSAEELMDLIHQLMDEMNQSVELNGTNVIPEVSFGISVFPFDAKDPETMMTHADMALQRGKSIARNQYWFFNRAMRTQLTTDTALEADLRIALVEKQFEMFYQPKVDIKTGKFHGFESLLRWRRPDGEIVAPGGFFTVAEDRGLMPYICDLVVERVISDSCAWRDMGLESGEVAVNIHPLQIKDLGRMQRLACDVETAGLSPENLVIEITEDCVVGRGTGDVPEILQFLRAQKFKISFDDFGTGYASLTHLKDLPVDEIKLDRSFIRDLMANKSDHSIVQAMINLAKSLGLTTVAEGIEQQEQHNILLSMGCDTGQGYFYGRPADFETATNYLRDAARHGQMEKLNRSEDEQMNLPKIASSAK